jgi:hypothetical protein
MEKSPGSMNRLNVLHRKCILGNAIIRNPGDGFQGIPVLDLTRKTTVKGHSFCRCLKRLEI